MRGSMKSRFLLASIAVTVFPTLKTATASILFQDSYATTPSTTGTPAYSYVGSTGVGAFAAEMVPPASDLFNDAENYLNITSSNATTGTAQIAAGFTASSTLVTVSFDIYDNEPTGASGTNTLQFALLPSGPTTNSSSNFQYFGLQNNGDLFTSAGATTTAAYAPDTATHLDLVYNNATSAVNFDDPEGNPHTVPAASGNAAQIEVFANGVQVGTGSFTSRSTATFANGTDYGGFEFRLPSGNNLDFDFQNFEVQTGANVEAVPSVPEPMSLGILAAGTGALLMRRRRNNA